MSTFKRFIPLLVILTLLTLIYFTGLIDYLSFDAIKKNREILKESVNSHPIAMPILYILFYIFITSLALPVDVFLSMFGGFLFPQPYCTIFATLGATVGASLLFLATRTAFGSFLRKYAGPQLQRMEAGFKKDAVYYLFFLRLIPIFPFWLVNIAPAFFGVAFSTFVWTTLIGAIPAAFAFTEAGTGLGSIFDSGKDLTLATLLNNEIKISLIALAFFALIPLFVKMKRKGIKPQKCENEDL